MFPCLSRIHQGNERDLLNEISKNLQEGSRERVKKGIEQALAEGISPNDILHKGLIAGMNAIAEKFKSGQMFLPEVLMVVGAMKAGLGIVRPLLTRAGIAPEGSILLGTVRGDIHDIGKNLVAIMDVSADRAQEDLPYGSDSGAREK